MGKSKIYLALALCCLAQPASILAGAGQAVTREYNNSFKAGVTYYQKGDFKTASGYLRQAVSGEYRSNPSAHYWLASALLKENRIDEAMVAFAEAYSLSPHTEVGHNSLKALQMYKTRIKQSERLKTQVSSLVRRSMSASPSRSPAPGNAYEVQEPVQLVDQGKLRSIKNQLRPIQKHNRPGPSPSDFGAWPVTQQANYVYSGAFQAISQARSDISDAQKQLSEAQARANGLVPTFRAYGEEEAKFEERKEASKKAYSQLLEPYRKELEKCTKHLNDAITIKNRAEQALNTPLYYRPYGVPLYR